MYHHYIFIISQLRLTAHPRSTVVLLGTRTPGTSREIYSEDADGVASSSLAIGKIYHDQVTLVPHFAAVH